MNSQTYMDQLSDKEKQQLLNLIGISPETNSMPKQFVELPEDSKSTISDEDQTIDLQEKLKVLSYFIKVTVDHHYKRRIKKITL